MAFERLVALTVTDEAGYQAYRDAMTPLLTAAGGRFKYDFDVARVRKSDGDTEINRVFMITFPDRATRDRFFGNPDYQAIRSRYYGPSVKTATVMAEFETAEPGEQEAPAKGSVGLIVALCLLAGLYAKLPAFLPSIDFDRFYAANAPFFVFSGLLAFFLKTGTLTNKIRNSIVAAFFFCVLYSNAVTQMFMLSLQKQPDSLVLAGIHLPFVLWSLLGVAFLGDDWRSRTGRLRYLNYTGETLIYSAIILIGGVALTLLTIGLFSLMGLNIGEWYIKWIVVLGAVSAPIVATYISTNRLVLSGKISPLMAKIFSPLLLITLVVYMIVLPAAGTTPFTDRNTLITCNAMLIAVLALSIFAIVERPGDSKPAGMDRVYFGLVCAGLLIDAVALSAILFRLASYGLSPNRVAVLGLNLVAFTHVAILWKGYFNYLNNKGTMTSVHEDIVKFLPVYAAWVSVVAFLFPLAVH